MFGPVWGRGWGGGSSSFSRELLLKFWYFNIYVEVVEGVIYWQIDCPSIVEFVNVFAIQVVSYIYWQID